jgi:hypothetical protein
MVKYVEPNPLSDAETAARKLIEILTARQVASRNYATGTPRPSGKFWHRASFEDGASPAIAVITLPIHAREQPYAVHLPRESVANF